jgi:heat shock protein HtpX
MFGGGRDDEGGGNPLALLAMAFLAPMAAGLLQMALSRSREFEADRSGAGLMGGGESLARALEKLEVSTVRESLLRSSLGP